MGTDWWQCALLVTLLCCLTGKPSHHPTAHTVTPSWHCANQTLTYSINIECQARERQVSILYIIRLTCMGFELLTFWTGILHFTHSATTFGPWGTGIIAVGLCADTMTFVVMMYPSNIQGTSYIRAGTEQQMGYSLYSAALTVTAHSCRDV